MKTKYISTKADYKHYISDTINFQEYQRGNHNRTIQRDWQHRVHKMKKT